MHAQPSRTVRARLRFRCPSSCLWTGRYGDLFSTFDSPEAHEPRDTRPLAGHLDARALLARVAVVAHSSSRPPQFAAHAERLHLALALAAPADGRLCREHLQALLRAWFDVAWQGALPLLHALRRGPQHREAFAARLPLWHTQHNSLSRLGLCGALS